jgi:hypothetical protein
MEFSILFKIIFICAYFAIEIKSKCRMKQECDPQTGTCKPVPADDLEPQILEGPDVVCPDYLGKMACCDNSQNIQLKSNFNDLQTIFGTAVGGCDICVVGLKRLWCDFTCHPNQHTFCKIYI